MAGTRYGLPEATPEALFAPENTKEIFRIHSEDKVRQWAKT